MVYRPLTSFNQAQMIKQCIIPKASSIHPPLSSSWDHIYPEVANLPHYKRFCFQSKLSKNIPVLETRAVRAHQRGLGSLSRTWASAGPRGPQTGSAQKSQSKWRACRVHPLVEKGAKLWDPGSALKRSDYMDYTPHDYRDYIHLLGSSLSIQTHLGYMSSLREQQESFSNDFITFLYCRE